jgi:hypothetical protein
MGSQAINNGGFLLQHPVNSQLTRALRSCRVYHVVGLDKWNWLTIGYQQNFAIKWREEQWDDNRTQSAQNVPPHIFLEFNVEINSTITIFVIATLAVHNMIHLVCVPVVLRMKYVFCICKSCCADALEMRKYCYSSDNLSK